MIRKNKYSNWITFRLLGGKIKQTILKNIGRGTYSTGHIKCQTKAFEAANVSERENQWIKVNLTEAISRNVLPFT